MNERIINSNGYVGGMSNSAFMTRVLPMFSLGLMMTGAGAYFGWHLPRVFLIFAVIVELIMVFTSSKWAYVEKRSLNVGLFLLFTTLSGMTLVPILSWGLNVGGPEILLQALGSTIAMFGGLAAYGLTTKKDFSGIGGFLFAALLGIIFASIINIFVGGTFFTLIISVVSLCIFAGFMLYDMSMIKNHFRDEDYIIAAIALYLNFINMFQDILRILGIFNLNSDD